MKILVACEESQAVCKAFRELGHEAYSNDLLECSGGYPEWHLKMDCFIAIEKYGPWDIIIMHPECTKLAVSGNRWYGKNTIGYNERLESVKWTQKLWDYATSVCDKVAMENPVGVLNSMGKFPKPQYIQPWQFGHGETKKTGLWLNGLPELMPTKIVSGREQKIWKMPPSKDRAKLRSKTYRGVAAAMANQWGRL
jgi:hypothetical protein